MLKPLRTTNILVFLVTLVGLGAIAHAGAKVAPFATAPLFLSNDPLTVSLEADLNTLFTERNKEKTVKGKLKLNDPLRGQDIEISVEVSVRGNTSLRKDECSFPKLRIYFTDVKELKGTLFESLKEFRMGTHCGEHEDSVVTPMGRLVNQKSPLRENLAYQLMSILEIPSQKSRLAEMTYIDPSTGAKLTRHAQILEDLSNAAARFDGKPNPYSNSKSGTDKGLTEVFSNAKDEGVDLDTLPAVFLFEAMINNFDWSLKISSLDSIEDSFANVKAVKTNDGKKLIFAYDFDLATAVTGHIERTPEFARYAKGGRDVLVGIAHDHLVRARALLPKSVMAKAENKFIATRPAIYAAIDRSHLDSDSKVLFRRHVSAFYRAIGAPPYNPGCSEELLVSH